MSRVLVYVIRLFVGVIIARQLGPGGMGIVAAILIIPETISELGHLGVPLSNVYYIGKGRNKETLLANSVIFIIASSLLYIVLAVALFPVLKRSYFANVEASVIVVAYLFIFLLLAKRFALDFLRSLEKYRTYSLVNAVQAFARLLLLLVLLYIVTLTPTLVVFTSVLGTAVSLTYGASALLKDTPLKLSKWSLNQFKDSLAFGLKNTVGSVFAHLNLRVDMLILAAFMDKQSLGVYWVAFGVANLFQFIPSSIGVVLLPKISGATGSRIHAILAKGVLLNLAVLVPSCALFLLLGKWLIIAVYGVEFQESYLLISVLLIGIVSLSIRLVLDKFFTGIGRPEIKAYVTMITLPIKALTLYFLVTYFHLIGAALSFSTTALVMLLITYYFYRRTWHTYKVQTDG